MPAEATPGPFNALIDVPGIRVGHHTAIGDGYLTGTTVVLAPDGGMVAGVDVRGGGPGTQETDLLNPTASVERIHAVLLTGGSAFGLAACSGVMTELADRGIGLSVGPDAGDVVPLVPGAVLFDLGRGGDFRARPTAEFGRAALLAAAESADAAAEPASTASGPGSEPRQVKAAVRNSSAHPGAQQGNVGAGTGAVSANLKGGTGTASVRLASGLTVGVLVAVNAAGSPIDPRTGALLGARLLLPDDGPAPAVPNDAGRAALLAATAPRPMGITFAAALPGSAPRAGAQIGNTTLAVVATDASLTKAQCTKLAQVAQNGMARALNPVHTMADGDVVFGAATCRAGVPDELGFHELVAAAADTLTRAIVRALLAARTVETSAGRWPTWADVVAGA